MGQEDIPGRTWKQEAGKAQILQSKDGRAGFGCRTEHHWGVSHKDWAGGIEGQSCL